MMMVIDLAFRNVMRNRERSLLTLIGVLLAVGSFVGLVSLAEGFQRRVKAELAGRDIHLYVMPKRASTLPAGPLGAVGFSGQTINREWLSHIESLPEVTRVGGVIRSAWEGAHGVVPVLGVDTITVRQFMPNLRPVEGGMLPTEPGDAAVGSAVVAADPSVAGQTLVIDEQDFQMSSQITGGGFKDHFIIVPLQGLLRARPNRGVHEIWVQLDDPNLAVSVAAKIKDLNIAKTQVLTRREYLGAAADVVNYAWLLQAAIAMIGVLIAVTASMNTMLMSTYERLKEFATLRAIGASRATVSSMVIAESIILNLAGGVLGLAFGWICSGVLDRAVGIVLEVSFPLAQVTPQLLLEGLALSVMVGLAGALIPCFLIYRLDLVSSLRWD